MIEHEVNYSTAPACNSGTGAPDMEVTPEMIKAGMGAYWREANRR